jgi:hypothetical protein
LLSVPGVLAAPPVPLKWVYLDFLGAAFLVSAAPSILI